MIKQTTDYEAFRSLLRESKYREYLTIYNDEHYAKMRVFVYEYAKAGFYIDKDGEIGNLVVNEPTGRGIGADLLRCAIKLGGTHLQCFDGFLPGYYGRFGFIRSGRQSWNDEFAPEGWDYAKNGRPNVVYMELHKVRKF